MRTSAALWLAVLLVAGCSTVAGIHDYRAPVGSGGSGASAGMAGSAGASGSGGASTGGSAGTSGTGGSSGTAGNACVLDKGMLDNCIMN